jgi:hypothetical protein
MLAIAFVAAFALAPSTRPRLVAGLPWVVGAYAIAGAIAAPLAYYALTGLIPASIAYPWTSSADLLNLVVPTRVIALGGAWLHPISERFPSNDTERPLYFGLPALVMVALFLLRRPWTQGTRFLVAAFGAATLVCFGTAFHVYGERLFWLPWSVPSHWKAFNDIAPDRFVIYGGLAVSVLVATWIATTPGRFLRRPVVLPVLAAVALVPLTWRDYDVQHPQRLAFFTSGAYKDCIPRGELLMIFPFARWGDTMLWQAESGFWFRMAEGSLMANNLPETFVVDPVVNKLLFSFLPPSPRATPDELLGLAQRRGVDRVVSAAYLGDAYPTADQMQVFGPVQTVEDVYVAPACHEVSLAARG